LTLITFPMKSLRWHRETHNCSLLSLTPITFDFNTFSCYGGSYFATIAVVSYILPKTSELGWAINAYRIRDTSYRCHCLLFRVCSSSELSSAFITTAPEGLQLSTSTHSFSYYTTPFFLSYMTRAWGMPTSFVHNLFYIPYRRLGPIGSLLPPTGSLLILSLSLFLTMVLSVEETLMNFGYTYAPNLIHQGASVITEISSANGYRNPTSSNSYESTHGPKITKKEFPKGPKLYNQL
jgi:hypothetical protein